MFEDVCYQKNYIKEVICRLDFASPIMELKSTMPKPIFDVIKKYYPIAEPQDIIGTELTINPINGPVVNQIVSKQWVFLSRDRKNKCTINSDNIVFSITNYNVFEELQTAVTGILSIVMQTFENNQGKRLGLRYINSFPLKSNENWIDAKFYQALSAHKGPSTTRLITTSEYAILDKDLSVRLIYGYDNPDYPSIIKREDFIIDIDAFTTGLIYSDDIEQFIVDMHTEVQSGFESMITDDFRRAANAVE